MSTRAARIDLPPELADQLAEILQRLRITNTAIQLWETEFSDAEREELGEQFPLGNLYEAYASFRHVSIERAVVELGAAADHITPATRIRLMRQLGENESTPGQISVKPQFDLETGQLVFKGKLLAKLRVRRSRTNRYRVLEAFQLASWANVIKNPLNDADQGTGIHQVLQELNQRVSEIRFSAHASGTQVSWIRAPK